MADELIQEEQVGDVVPLSETGEINFDDFNREIDLYFAEVKARSQRNDLSAATQAFDKLEELKRRYNFLNFSEYSLELLTLAEEAFKRGDVEKSSFLAHRGKVLSPFSPVVSLLGIPIFWKTGVSSMTSEIKNVITRGGKDPNFLLSLQINGIPFLLGLLTVVSYFLYVFLFPRFITIFWPDWSYPGSSKHIPSLLIATFCIIFPTFFAPFICITVWTLLVLFTSSYKSIVPMIWGVAILVWGLMLPVLQRATTLNSSPEYRALYRVLGNDYSVNDDKILSGWYHQSNDDNFPFAVALLAIRSRQYDLAESILSSLSPAYQQLGFVQSELGKLYLLQNKVNDAALIYQALPNEYSPEFLYNFSRIRFAQIETVRSEKLIAEARLLDPELIDNLLQLEKAKDAVVYATVIVPYGFLFESSLTGRDLRHDNALAKKLGGDMLEGFFSLILGGVVMAIGVLNYVIKPNPPLRSLRALRKSNLLAAFFSFLPGGYLIALGYESLGITIMATFLVMLSPFVVENYRLFFFWFPEMRPLLFGVLGVVWLAGCFLGIKGARNDTK